MIVKKNNLRKFIIQQSLSPSKEYQPGHLRAGLDSSSKIENNDSVASVLRKDRSPKTQKTEDVVDYKKRPIKLDEYKTTEEEYGDDFELSQSNIGETRKLGESGFGSSKSPMGNDKDDSRLFNSRYLEKLDNMLSNNKPNQLDLDLNKFK